MDHTQDHRPGRVECQTTGGGPVRGGVAGRRFLNEGRTTPEAIGVAALFVLVALHPPGLPAQSVQGQVLDTVTHQALPQVTVLLLHGERGDSALGRTVSDGQGQFRLQGPTTGTYRLRCLMIGYQPVTTPPFDLRRGDPPLEVEVRISRLAVLLAPLTIVSQRRARLPDTWLAIEGYYEREHRYGREGLGIGRFFNRDSLELRNAYYVSDIVRMLPGVRVEGGGGRSQVITFPNMVLGGRCVPTVFVNGTPIANGADVNDLVTPFEVAAVEVYPGPVVPGEYTEPGMEMCGSIVLWTGFTGAHRTRHPSAPRAEPLVLALALSLDTAIPRDSVLASLTLRNRSGESVALCIRDAQYTLNGAGTSREFTTPGAPASCADTLHLGPRTSRTWAEIVVLSKGDHPGVFLLQYRLDILLTPCRDGPWCERSVESNWQQLVVPEKAGGS